MDINEIIWNHLNPDYDLNGLMRYLKTDTLVSWFVDEGYVDDLDEEEQTVVREHYEEHCC